MRRYESDTRSTAGPCGGDCHSPDVEWDTLRVYHTNDRLEICSRGAHSNCRWMYEMCCDGPFGNSWMAVRDNSAITRKENAAKVCRRSSSRAANSGSADACTNAKSHRNEHPTMQRKVGNCSVCGSSRRHKGEEESGDIFGRPHSSVQTSLRRLHVNLGHPKNNVLIRHLRHAPATQQTLEAARNFECPACESAKQPSSRTTVLSDRSPTSS